MTGRRQQVKSPETSFHFTKEIKLILMTLLISSSGIAEADLSAGIRGTVSGKDGIPVIDAVILLRQDHFVQELAISDVNGAWKIDHLVPGTYELVIKGIGIAETKPQLVKCAANRLFVSNDTILPDTGRNEIMKGATYHADFRAFFYRESGVNSKDAKGRKQGLWLRDCNSNRGINLDALLWKGHFKDDKMEGFWIFSKKFTSIDCIDSTSDESDLRNEYSRIVHKPDGSVFSAASQSGNFCHGKKEGVWIIESEIDGEAKKETYHQGKMTKEELIHPPQPY